eukprot:c3464_g1_i1.p1 GENE.c3464_g1_i1~~c3464_g1_i1.p1  ORF type:complete len:317 (+),score=33.97 c3464_g1_i1:55-1005(+)
MTTLSSGTVESIQAVFEQIFEDEHDDELTYHQHLVSGAVAGIVEHCSIFPLDTIKTRMQFISWKGCATECCSRASLYTTGANIVKAEGGRRLFRGITAMALGAGPSHAVYFASYEKARKMLGGDTPGHHPFANAVSGMVATVAGDLILTPMDTLKQRLQMCRNPQARLHSVASMIYREEGVRAFYASFGTTLVMNIPFAAIQFSCYHALKEHLDAQSFAPGSTQSLVCHWMSGGIAGAVAAGLTTPLDVTRTALQTQGMEGMKFQGFRQAITEIVRRDGFLGLTRGWAPRMLFHIPGTAICWTAYEYCKDMFGLYQ